MKDAEIKDRVPASVSLGYWGGKQDCNTRTGAVRFKEGNRQFYRGNDYATFERDWERRRLTLELSGVRRLEKQMEQHI